MAPNTKAVSTRPEKALISDHLKARLHQTLQHVPTLLPDDIEPDAFRAALWLHLQQVRDLNACIPDSVLRCTIKAAMLGELPGKDCYFLPFRNKHGEGKELQFVEDYRGVCRRLMRTGQVARPFAHPVHEGDQFTCDYFSSDRPSHVPAEVLGKEPGKIRFYYAAILMLNGTCHFEVVSLARIDAIRQQAPGKEQDAWQKWPVAMSRKTALKQLEKYVQLTGGDQEDEDDPPAPVSDARKRELDSDLYGDKPALPGRESVDTATGEVHEYGPDDGPPWVEQEHGAQAPQQEEIPL